MIKEDDYLIDGYSLNHIRNSIEKEVINAIKEVRTRYPEFCNCTICLEDVYGASLNMLPSRYVQQSTFIFPHQRVPADEILGAVEIALQKVIEKPSHE